MFSQDLNLFQMVSNSGIVVLAVLILLLSFSVSCWAIILIKFRYIRRSFSESAEFMDFFWKSRDFSDAFARSKQMQNSPIARVFRVGYVELRKMTQSVSPAGATTVGETAIIGSRFVGIDNVKRALRRAINTEVTRVTQLVPFLATTGNTTPFIGLFGTVWGIMNSFHGIGQRGSASLAVVAPGISEALVATAAGLAAAIPAVIAFNYFMQKIRILETELHSFADDFLNIIERDILRHNGRG
jgi:biopolymer transport protein TolQ